MSMPSTARDKGTAMMELRLKLPMLEHTIITIKMDDATVAAADIPLSFNPQSILP